MKSISSTEQIYWIAVSHLLNVNVRRLGIWLQEKGNFQSLFSASKFDLVETGFTAVEIERIQTVNWKKIEYDQKWYEKRGNILTLQDTKYPRLLKEIADPPLVLYVEGEVDLLSAPQLAMVGSRNPSPLGYKTAQEFAEALAQAGLVITSGMAMGIDGACHKSVLSAQKKTIAVIATGLDRVYPAVHRRLAEQIKSQGAIVSEFPLNTMPLSWHFPRRNRIISGLSLGVFVVEAALQSGSLITARYAMEQNREVFAMPGSIYHILARGCHHLIQQGAKLVVSLDDILDELKISKGIVETKEVPTVDPLPKDELDSNHQYLLKYLNFSVTSFDALVVRSGLTAAEVSSMLLLLELKGYVQMVQGGYLRCDIESAYV